MAHLGSGRGRDWSWSSPIVCSQHIDTARTVWKPTWGQVGISPVKLTFSPFPTSVPQAVQVACHHVDVQTNKPTKRDGRQAQVQKGGGGGKI